MSRKMKTAKTLLLSAAMMAAGSMSAFAMTKHIDLHADLENIPEHNAGEAFLPEYELETEDDNISLSFGAAPLPTANPTVPFNYKLRIHSDNESLDEDLKIRGTGIRSTYVDYVSEDNAEAEARLQVYPFYELPAPEPTLDKTEKKVSWKEIPYAGQYEYVITYTTKNGDTKTSHGKTKQCNVSVASAISQDADGEIGFAVRGLATAEEGYAEAEVRNGKAYWEFMDWADRYRVRVQYTNHKGETVKKEQTVEGTNCNVQSYISSAKDGQIRVTVRAIPGSNDHSYYNIAPSEFGMTGGEMSDVSDYEIEDLWSFLADYQAVVDGNFSANVETGASKGTTGVNNNPFGTPGQWKRVAYRWQYLENGAPFAGGWKKLGNDWYYFDPDGYMHTGWLTDHDGKKYYLETIVGSGQGKMLTGTKEIAGVEYHFGADGALQ